MGMESGDSGNIVGAALTTRETPHKVRLSGRDLYAWCALDTLFIPGLLGEDAESWAVGHQAAVTLSVEEGAKLARWHWVERYRRAIGRAP